LDSAKLDIFPWALANMEYLRLRIPDSGPLQLVLELCDIDVGLYVQRSSLSQENPLLRPQDPVLTVDAQI
jgi:hypothetical protein